MSVLLFLLVPALVVAAAALVTWVRNHQPTSLQSGVDSFRREMDALSPDAVPEHRRRTDPSGPPTDAGPAQVGQPFPPATPSPPRRPPTPDRPS